MRSTHPGPHRHGWRPLPWQRRWLAVVAVALLASGGAWLALHYTLGAGAGELPHPAEPWLMRLHGAAAFGALFGAGLVGGHHVPAAWALGRHRQHARQRRTGLLLVLLAGAVVLSGYALFYLVPEAWRPALGWTHAGLGAAAALLGAWHGRQHRRRHARAAGRAGLGAADPTSL